MGVADELRRRAILRASQPVFLALRVAGAPSGSLIKTSRLLIFSPRRGGDLQGDFSARSTSSSDDALAQPPGKRPRFGD